MSRNQKQDKTKLIAELRKTPIVQVACERTGVPRTTFYRWTRHDPQFAEACEAAMEESSGMINDMAESQLIAAIKEKNMSAIIFWLKHNHRNYETRVKVDARLQREPEELTPEQAELVEKALQHAGLLMPTTEEPPDGNDGSQRTGF